MKSYQWLIVSVMSLFVLTLCLVVGATISYAYMLPKTFPETIVLTREVIVEQQVPFEIITTVEVIKEVEKIVEVTPTPPAVGIVMPTEPIVTELVTKPQCSNIAWIIQQPQDRVQSGALKLNTEYKSTIIIENVGTCDWIGYALVSKLDPMIVEVPVTYPGERAIIEIRLDVRYPLEFKWVMVADDGMEFTFQNGSYVDGTMNFRMDVYSDSTYNIQIPSELGGGILSCGPMG